MSDQLSLNFGAGAADSDAVALRSGSPSTALLDAPVPAVPGELSPAFDGAGVLVRELAQAVRHRAWARKVVVVARTRGEGKELLRQVALRGQSWAGIEVTTVQPLALQAAMPAILRNNWTVADRFDEQAVAERALDETISSGEGRFGRFVNKVGFRDAVRRSVATLREGGVRAAKLTSAIVHDREKQALVAEVLGRYEELLHEGGLVDSASVLELALAALEAEGHSQAGDPSQGVLDDQAVYLLPGLSDRGLSGRFVRVLQSRGALLLKTDAVEGLPAPVHLLWDVKPAEASGSWLHAVERWTADDAQGRLDERPPKRRPFKRIDLFAAASVYDELRGVLRRVLDRGARWDEVEIVTPDPNTYGSALHALAAPMGIPVNFGVGLPVERTRPGRVASAYFRWIENGYPEPVIRALVEAEDVKAPKPGDKLWGPRLARSLRGLRIGWGRSRYLDKVKRALEDLPHASKRRYEDDDKFERRKKRTEEDMRALRGLLAPVLAATPQDDASVSPAQVAKGVKSLLAMVAPGTPTDDTARERLKGILDRIEATQTRLTDFASACNVVKGFLQVSVPAPKADGAAPWSAIPGHLHLSDFEHGGATGRRFTFVVGMDSARFPGSGLEDPLLLDQERWRLGKGVLPLAKDRSAEARFLFAGLFARLRGEVALSYCRWDPSEARELDPAPELLQAHRLGNGDASLTFEDLENAMGLAESRLPRPEVQGDMDASDVWLRKLASKDGKLRDGLAAVCRSHPGLARGMAVDEALSRAEASVHVGILGTGRATGVGPAVGVGQASGTDGAKPSYADPLSLNYSASALETLGACPRRFLLQKIVRARPPDDPEFDPGRWLDSRQRGHLLHSVFEGALSRTKSRANTDGLDPNDDDFLEVALDLLDQKGQQARRDIPSPSAAVQEWEMEALRGDVRSFVEMIRRNPPNWLALEYRFGFDDDRAEVSTPAGPIRLAGAIDRVDDLPTGLRIVDYKTGTAWAYSSRSGIYNGGRRLQHVLYCQVASQRLGKGKQAERMEFHFPTRRGQNDVKAYEREKLRGGGELVAVLLDGVSKGWFPATDNAKDDCRFCDYKEVCDVREHRNAEPTSRFVEWTKRNLEEVEELSALMRARKFEEEGDTLVG